MAINPRNNKTNKRKKSNKFEQVGEGHFHGLEFVVKESSIYDKSESLHDNPYVFFKDDVVILDYGHFHKKSDDRKKIKLFFQSTVSAGDQITIEHGEYLNEQNAPEIYDIGGLYTFVDFDEDSFIITLNLISVNNQSPTYDNYEKNYFINGTLKWTTESTTDESKTENINEIINRLGWKSNNSFYHIFKSVRPNDIIEIKTDKVNIDSYTVVNYYRDDEGQEHISVMEDVPSDKVLFGTKTFCSLKRDATVSNKTKTTTTRRITAGMAKNPKISDDNPTMTNPQGMRNTPTRTPRNPKDLKNPSTNKISEMKYMREASDSAINIALKRWRNSGKKVFNVQVNKHNTEPKFVIDGVETPILSLQRGVTYKFLQSHASNKSTKGVEFLLTFTGIQSTDIAKSHAPPGTRDSYVYLTVPAINRTGSMLQITYTCQNNNAIGNVISIK